MENTTESNHTITKIVTKNPKPNFTVTTKVSKIIIIIVITVTNTSRKTKTKATKSIVVVKFINKKHPNFQNQVVIKNLLKTICQIIQVPKAQFLKIIIITNIKKIRTNIIITKKILTRTVVVVTTKFFKKYLNLKDFHKIISKKIPI